MNNLAVAALIAAGTPRSKAIVDDTCAKRAIAVHTVSLLKNNGSGTLAAQVTYNVGSGPEQIVVVG